MASWALSQRCVFRSLPAAFPRPQSGRSPASRPLPPASPGVSSVTADGIGLRRSSGRWEWAFRVSAPSRVAPLEDERESYKRSDEPTVSGSDEKEAAFDPGMAPPFGLAEIRAVIPKHCWVKDPWRSMSYVVRDVAAVLGLVAVAAYINSWIVWPFYWVAQGTMFWALFVLGHDWYGNLKILTCRLYNIDQILWQWPWEFLQRPQA